MLVTMITLIVMGSIGIILIHGANIVYKRNKDILSLYERNQVIDILYSIHLTKFLKGEISLSEFIGGNISKWVYVEITDVILIDPQSYIDEIKPPRGCKLFRIPKPPVVFKAHVLDSILNTDELKGKDILIIWPRTVYDAERGKIVYDDEIRPLIPGKRYVLSLMGHFPEVKRRIYFICREEDGRIYDIRSTVTLLEQDVYTINEILIFVEVNNKIYHLYSDEVLKDQEYNSILDTVNTFFKYRGNDLLFTKPMTYVEFKDKLVEELKS